VPLITPFGPAGTLAVRGRYDGPPPTSKADKAANKEAQDLLDMEMVLGLNLKNRAECNTWILAMQKFSPNRLRKNRTRFSFRF
jgi:hypothetical protein